MTTRTDSSTLSESLSRLYSTLPDDNLLGRFDDARYTVATAQKLLGLIEQEIYRRLEDRGARAIPDNDFICELQEENTYQQELFAPLKELLVTADLEAVLKPAHDELVHVPDKWATQKVIALGRRLPEVQAVVDKAKLSGRPKLRFEKRA